MAQFFASPLNYGSGRSQYAEVADNNYETATTHASMLLHIDTAGDGTGPARAFTDIFVKCTGVTDLEAAFTNPANITSPKTRTLPATVTNDSGDSVETTVDGYQHDLHSLWTDESAAKPEAKSVTLTFTGTNVRIYEVMLLNRLLTLDSDGGFSRIEYDSVDLGGVAPDLRGRLSYVPPIGGERDKWLCRLTALSYRSDTERDKIADALIRFIRKHKNFVFAPEPNRYPERIFPAVWPDATTQIRYLARWKGGGRSVSFAVREA